MKTPAEVLAYRIATNREIEERIKLKAAADSAAAVVNKAAAEVVKKERAAQIAAKLGVELDTA